MKQLFRNKELGIVSILLSLTCLALLLKVNNDIYNEYLQTAGKTWALFGLRELKYFYKYYYAIFGAVGLVIALVGMRRKESKLIYQIAIFFSILVFALTFISVWKWFI